MPRRERSRVRTDSDRRTRWTAEEAGRVLRALDESGLSRREFCEREGLIPERSARDFERALELIDYPDLHNLLGEARALEAGERSEPALDTDG